MQIAFEQAVIGRVEADQGHEHPHIRLGQAVAEQERSAGGKTRLIGRTWYSLNVRPAGYYDWWTHDIFSAVHLRVMKNIQRLVEGGG